MQQAQQPMQQLQKKLIINRLFIVFGGVAKVAGTVGFEPTDDGIKTRCLTTWRRPNLENCT